MPSDRKQLRGTILSEDRRTERFLRELLGYLGFHIHKFNFITAPSGRGDAAAWVRAQYPSEVTLLRRKRHQRLSLIAVRDGDNVGLVSRKADLDRALGEAGLDRRERDELIVTLVPTWSIETWLLALLRVGSVDEASSQKIAFERNYAGKNESQALRDAAISWDSLRRRVDAQRWEMGADPISSVPSLADSKIEMRRIGVT